MLTALLTSFGSVFMAELGDKTQLVTLSLSSRYPPAHVLGGAMLALVILVSLAVALGSVIYAFVPFSVITIVSGAFFIMMGIWNYIQPEGGEGQKKLSGSGFAQAFGVTLIAEMGDKTQLAVLMLSASFGSPWAVLLGSILAMLANHTLAAFLGSKLLVLVPPHLLRIGTTAIFLMVGLGVLYLGITNGE